MALGLEVATLAGAWTSENIAGKPRSGDRGYDVFNLNQVPLGLRRAAIYCTDRMPTQRHSYCSVSTARS